MLYSEILKNSEIQKRLKDAGVDHVESYALKNGDFSSVEYLDSNAINLIADNEILFRRKFIENKKREDVHEERIKPFRKLDAKAKFIRPHFEALIQGKFSHPYSTIERAVIDSLADKAAKEYDFDPDTGAVESADFSGLSELDKLLKQASIVRLNQKMSPEEISQRVFLSGPHSSWLK